MSRTIAPPLGTSITKYGLVELKSTPFLMRSSLFLMSSGFVLTEWVATSASIYSISSQYFPVVVVPGVPDVVD